jgi:uncharacterized membrane protein YhaH (DUF805 family)
MSDVANIMGHPVSPRSIETLIELDWMTRRRDEEKARRINHLIDWLRVRTSIAMSVKVDRTADEQQIMKKRKSVLQRWFYALVGLLTMIPIILLTAKQIQNLERENNYQLAIYLLLLVHSGLCWPSMSSLVMRFLSVLSFCASINAVHCALLPFVTSNTPRWSSFSLVV